MEIRELQARMTNVDVEGDVVEITGVKEFNKFGKQGRVANAFVQDSSGKVKLSLWNEQIDKIKVGDRIKITKGYVGEFQGELQLTTGKFGTLEVLSSKTESPKEETPKVEEKKPETRAASEPETKPQPAHSDVSDDSLDIEEEDVSK
jgi:replication factor A1